MAVPEPSAPAVQRQRYVAAKRRAREAHDVKQSVDENWLPIPGFEGFYEVSDLGRLRSCDRSHSHFNKRVGLMTRSRKSQILSTKCKSAKYLTVILSRNGLRRSYSVHSLVCLAFRGPRPEGFEVRHLDGDARNNRADNLQYGTKIENAADREAHGRTIRGQAHRWSTISDTVVAEVLKDRQRGLFYYQIAERHGISRGHVCNICNGRRYPAGGSNVSA